VRALILSFAVFAYSIAVLISVAWRGEIGVRCIYGVTVREASSREWNAKPVPLPLGKSVPKGAGDRFSSTPPIVGDTVLDIGPRPIGNYRDYVRAIREVSPRIGDLVEVRWQGQDQEIRYGQVKVRRTPMSTYIWSFVWFLQEMIVFSVGFRVYWNRPKDESARLFFWLCVVTVGAFMGGYHWSRIVIYQPLIFLFGLFAVFVPVVSLHFYLVFPRANPFYEAHQRALKTVLYGIPTAAIACIWGTMIWSTFDKDSLHIVTALYLLSNFVLGYVGLSVAVFFLCLVCLGYSFRRAASRAERNQVQWILLATLLSFVPISYLLWDTWNDPARLGMASTAWPMFVVSLLYTIAYAISITRYRLMEAESYLNRGVVYFLVSLTAGLVYSALLVAATVIINDSPLVETTEIGAVVVGITALVILVIWESARQRFQKVIDRRFFREKSKFDRAMKKMGQAVGNLVDRETLGRRLLEAAAEVMRLEWGAIYLEGGGNKVFELTACHGPEPDEKVILPANPLIARLQQVSTIRVSHALTADFDPATDATIALGGEVAAALSADDHLAGLLILGPKRSGMPYEDEELAFLGALGSVAALALRSADIQLTLEVLNLELRDKVDKIAEQQRRILILQNQLAGHHVGPAAEPELGEELQSPEVPAIFAPIKGSGPAVRRMIDVARKVAASPSAVLIRGESGTGKELLADAIHAGSPRASKPLVKVHCAALSQNLLESELFGHVKSAFTGADRDRIGRFQQANGGTLFLDEIGDINWEVQTKLLRVLQEMSFERVGSSQSMTVDVRILAATHQDLEALIRAGRFREDLYYRLNVISLRAPSLRERKEDVFELAVHFLNIHARTVGKNISHLDDTAIEALVAYDWPGNIRELENAIERAVVLSDGPAVTVEDLPAEIRSPARRRSRMVSSRVPALAGVHPSGTITEIQGIDDGDDPEYAAFEYQRLQDALAGAKGNKSEAARLLGIPRSTFFSRLKKHGLA
jgi:transcriptional regulator with GAF, ATPase, and Fis domain